MLVNVTEDIANHSDALILNRGYYGMNLKTDTSYRLSLFLKNRNYSAPLRVFLVDEWGQRVSNVIEVNVGNRDWTKYTGELKPEKNVRRGMFAIQPMSKGQFQMDVVSLFPSDTWNDGKSVFRKDIVQNLKEFSPSFIRFPGGCIVHGVNEETMYHWKRRSDRLKIVRDSGANGRLITVPTESAIMSFMNCANMWELMRCM